MEDLLIQFIVGNISGWAQVTAGMPLDLFKTKLQLNHHITLQSIKDDLAHYGGFFKTFYRGASSMYMFIGMASAIEYVAFQTSLKLLNRFSLSKEWQLVISGSMAGIFSSFIYTPIEFAKIHTQIDPKSISKGSIQRLLYILRTEKWGGLRRMYTGNLFQIFKDGPGSAIFYGGFHLCMQDLFNEKNRELASFRSQFYSALIVSAMYNLWAYPLDTLKTNVQSGRSTVKEMFKNRFWTNRTFTHGLYITLLRGIIIDIINLVTYERIKNGVVKLMKKELH